MSETPSCVHALKKVSFHKGIIFFLASEISVGKQKQTDLIFHVSVFQQSQANEKFVQTLAVLSYSCTSLMLRIYF